jgi:Flp pilus assembly protein TadD
MVNPSHLTAWRQRAVPVACLLAAALGTASGPALAQSNYSRPVVQPVPPPSLGELNAALKDLSRNPGNVSALLRAGWASLGLDDTQAALGFFRRAAGIQPQNGEVKAGVASASLRQGDPVAAVRLFSEAEATGTPMFRYAGDRGLALDLVGDNVAAQQFYRQALALRSDPEIIRRLALSQAIAGDQRATEATLLPLLQNRDLASYRTRAFALAILGKGEEAVSIAQTMLPPQISNRMAPYLRYMPRLTRAQQAAAANLGQFPPASEIGRDNPQIAALSAAAAPRLASATPDARLVPTGEPLGRRGRKAGEARRSDKPVKAQPAAAKTAGTIGASYAPIAQTASSPPPASAPQIPLPAPRVAAAVQPPPPRVANYTAPQTFGSASPAAPSAQGTAAGQSPPLAASKSVMVASIDPQPSSSPPPPSFEPAPKPPMPIAAATVPPPPKETVSLADAFADFAKPGATPKPAVGAVDISTLKPVREASKSEGAKAEAAKAAKAKAKPKPPANPQRFWAQVATGRDAKALAFDWRRLQRDAGALLAKRDAYTARWGQTRRLLTGPYKSEDEADKAVAALKKKGIDAFEFTSDEGEEVTPLK